MSLRSLIKFFLFLIDLSKTDMGLSFVIEGKSKLIMLYSFVELIVSFKGGS
jgi:hypothetical protein